MGLKDKLYEKAQNTSRVSGKLTGIALKAGIVAGVLATGPIGWAIGGASLIGYGIYKCIKNQTNPFKALKNFFTGQPKKIAAANNEDPNAVSETYVRSTPAANNSAAHTGPEPTSISTRQASEGRRMVTTATGDLAARSRASTESASSRGSERLSAASVDARATQGLEAADNVRSRAESAPAAQVQETPSRTMGSGGS